MVTKGNDHVAALTLGMLTDPYPLDARVSPLVALFSLSEGVNELCNDPVAKARRFSAVGEAFKRGGG